MKKPKTFYRWKLFDDNFTKDQQDIIAQWAKHEEKSNRKLENLEMYKEPSGYFRGYVGGKTEVLHELACALEKDKRAKRQKRKGVKNDENYRFLG